jgi:transcriptional regulator NrdR family protein
MVCINCFYPSTNVTNSRPHKKEALIWRRRHCKHCGTTFTTRERPSLKDNQKVLTHENKTEDFSLGRLTLSIAKAFTHSQKDAQYYSLWLAQSVEDQLSTQREHISLGDIEATTHMVLKRFDELAAVQYAGQHGLISSVRRRGRPSLA